MKILLTLLCLTPAALFAQEKPELTVLRQNLQQGGFLIGTAPVGSTVSLNGASTLVGKKGEFVVGFDREAPLKSTLKICASTQTCTTQKITLKKRTYKTQNVTKIPKETVTPDPKQEEVIKQDNLATAAARTEAKQQSARFTAFTKVFELPIKAETSGVYGSRRTYNGEERSWHKGHDLAAGTGTPVHAPANGVVRLARETFMSGNLIMLDHGGGITSVYAHLSQMDVKVGDEVQTGDLIGKVGTTGRSSGPHLHWGMYWQNIAIDPILWVKE